MSQPLADRWRPPHRALIERAWREHAQHGDLERLQTERDHHGEPAWRLIADLDGVDEDAWEVVYFAPCNPRDEREALRITSYPLAWKERQRLDAQTIAGEHSAD